MSELLDLAPRVTTRIIAKICKNIKKCLTEILFVYLNDNRSPVGVVIMSNNEAFTFEHCIYVCFMQGQKGGGIPVIF